MDSSYQSPKNDAGNNLGTSKPLALVLLGESGSGKSASGNSLLRSTEIKFQLHSSNPAFVSKPSSKAVTTVCVSMLKEKYGTLLNVIDTPDFFDEDLSKPDEQISQCKDMRGDLYVYLLVIQIGRFTEGERDILRRLEKALDPELRERAIILFTHGDDLKSQHIDDYVDKTNPDLQKLISECGTRYLAFNNNCNKREAERQVDELVKKICELVQEKYHCQVFPNYDPNKQTNLGNLNLTIFS